MQEFFCAYETKTPLKGHRAFPIALEVDTGSIVLHGFLVLPSQQKSRLHIPINEMNLVLDDDYSVLQQEFARLNSTWLQLFGSSSRTSAAAASLGIVSNNLLTVEIYPSSIYIQLGDGQKSLGPQDALEDFMSVLGWHMYPFQ